MILRWLKYPPPSVRLKDWKDNRRWKRLMKDTLYFQRYVEGDVVTDQDDKAVEAASQLRWFLQLEWGVREGSDG